MAFHRSSRNPNLQRQGETGTPAQRQAQRLTCEGVSGDPPRGNAASEESGGRQLDCLGEALRAKEGLWLLSTQSTGELWVALTWGFCDLVVKFVFWEIDIVYTVES